jgi:hypothetical protein
LVPISMKEVIEGMMCVAFLFYAKIATPAEIRGIYLTALVASRQFDG